MSSANLLAWGAAVLSLGLAFYNTDKVVDVRRALAEGAQSGADVSGAVALADAAATAAAAAAEAATAAQAATEAGLAQATDLAGTVTA